MGKSYWLAMRDDLKILMVTKLPSSQQHALMAKVASSILG